MSWRKYVFLTIGVLFSSQLTECDAQTGPILETTLGSIRGSILTSDQGADIYAFRGIPFAKAPTKELRFSPPQPYDKEYNGIFDATEDGNVCIQYNHFAKTFTGDEDCLYLNVYASKLPSQDLTELLPVMVWIHGGGFFIGSGTSAEYGPQRLVDRNVILVGINYRLGPFGFLSTLDEYAPGNYGLLDQVMALRWVRDNIASFGGDPNKVTIFGESAGGISIGFHLFSPLSKGLFHAAIAQSGSALAEFIVARDDAMTLRFAEDVARRLNCPTDCKKKMVACIKKRPALDVMIKSALTTDNYTEMGADIVTFKPVVDIVRGTDAFLPDFPQKLMAKKKFNAVPFMAGVNKDEGILFLSSTRGFGGPAAFGKEHVPFLLKQIAPSLFSNEEQGLKSAKLLAAEYFENVEKSNLNQKIVALNNFLGDLIITYMVDAQNDFLIENGVPTYVYKFTHKGEHSVIDSHPLKAILPQELQIVAHADELQNLFHGGGGGFFQSAALSNEEDRKMSDIMLTMWTNFAKASVPIIQGSVYDHPALNWEPLDIGNHQYLELNTNPHMVSGHLSYNYGAWNSIYNLVNDHKDEL